jgi:hypothetical protein
MKKLIIAVLLIAVTYFAYTKFFNQPPSAVSMSADEKQFIKESEALWSDYKNKFDDPQVKLAVYDRCSAFSLMFQFPPKELPEAKQYALEGMAYVDLTKATLELIKASFKGQEEATSNAEMKNMDKVNSDYKAYIATHYLNKNEDISQDALLKADYQMCSEVAKALPHVPSK